MPASRRHRSYAIVLSVLGHAALVVALTFSLPLQTPQRPGAAEEIVPIDTVMISEAALDAELARIDAERIAEEQAQLQAEREAEAERIRVQQEAEAAAERQRIAEAQAAEAERQRREEAAAAERIRLEQEAEAQAEAERRRREEERLAEQERLEEQRRLEAQRAEEARIAEERRLAEEEARRAAEAAARRAAIAAEVARAAEAEEEANRAREAGLQDQWLAQISNRIERFWRRPPTAQPGIVCVLDVDWVRTGDVVGVTVVEAECNGDAATRRSIESAVLEASPLPQPPVPSLFDRNLRIRFAPD